MGPTSTSPSPSSAAAFLQWLFLGVAEESNKDLLECTHNTHGQRIRKALISSLFLFHLYTYHRIRICHWTPGFVSIPLLVRGAAETKSSSSCASSRNRGPDVHLLHNSVRLMCSGKAAYHGPMMAMRRNARGRSMEVEEQSDNRICERVSLIVRRANNGFLRRSAAVGITLDISHYQAPPPNPHWLFPSSVADESHGRFRY